MLDSGVYGIFSKIDDRVYIGSATNFDLRKKTHFDKLKSNVHVNKLLQNFVNKYGIKNVEFTEEHKQNLKLAAQKRSKELSQKHKGNNNPSAKLNWDTVDYIRTSKKSVKDLATELSVSITTIYKIKNNQTWLA